MSKPPIKVLNDVGLGMPKFEPPPERTECLGLGSPNLGQQAKSMGYTIEQDNRGYVSLIRLPKNLPLNLIAELTGKNHQHVRRDIKKMLADLSLNGERYIQTWTSPRMGRNTRNTPSPKTSP